MSKPEEIKDKISLDRDYIHIKRFDFSLKKLLERYPDGAPVHVICQALMISEDELETLYQKILLKLKEKMK